MLRHDGLLLPSIVRYWYVLRLSPREKVLNFNLLLLERMEVNRLLGSNLKCLCLLKIIKKKTYDKEEIDWKHWQKKGQQPTTLI